VPSRRTSLSPSEAPPLAVLRAALSTALTGTTPNPTPSSPMPLEVVQQSMAVRGAEAGVGGGEARETKKEHRWGEGVCGAWGTGGYGTWPGASASDPNTRARFSERLRALVLLVTGSESPLAANPSPPGFLALASSPRVHHVIASSPRAMQHLSSAGLTLPPPSPSPASHGVH